jgi:uncharacterized membrane protein
MGVAYIYVFITLVIYLTTLSVAHCIMGVVNYLENVEKEVIVA